MDSLMAAKQEKDLATETAVETLEMHSGAAVAREEFGLRRQRKEILEKCRRIAIVGLSEEPSSESYVRTEKLLGAGLEIAPILSHRQTYLGVLCYGRLEDVPGSVDIVQVYPRGELDLPEIAREAAKKNVQAFWIEEGVASPEALAILADTGIEVVEYESLMREYVKHFPFPAAEARSAPQERHVVQVATRMTKNPKTVQVHDSIQEAMEKMEKGHFHHLPVVNEEGKLIGMLSDRDVRLIRPCLAFVTAKIEALQLASTAVRQAAVFNPVTVTPEVSLVAAAKIMLRWEIGALPVVVEENLVGIITYTDLMREFISIGDITAEASVDLSDLTP